jgi:hypothetical protein
MTGPNLGQQVAQFLTSVVQFLTPLAHIQASKFVYTFPMKIKILILTGYL